MNLTNASAASLCLVFLKTAMLMPATMGHDRRCREPRRAPGPAPRRSRSASCRAALRLFSALPATSASPALPLAKSLTAWFPGRTRRCSGLAILSAPIKSTYCLTAATSLGRVERAACRRVEQVGAVLLAEDEGVVGVLADAAALEAMPYWPPAWSASCASATNSAHVVGGAAMPAVAEQLLVVVQAVRQRVERDRGRVLARRAGGRARSARNRSLPPIGLQRRVVERQERAGRLQRRRPGVADVQHVRALAGGGGGRDAVEQVGPADDLEVDLDAGLRLELVQLGLEQSSCRCPRWCPGCSPSR